VASALVAGSLAPDVPFFADSLLRGSYGYGALTHRAWAVPTVDVALAAALVAGWHAVLREPLVELLPARWADAADAATAPSGRPLDVPGAAWFALSAAIGAATHVGWDAFTHGGRIGVRLLPVLDRTVHGQPVYSLLQYGFSAAGLAALAWHLPRTLRRTAAPRPVAEPVADAAPTAPPTPPTTAAPASVSARPRLSARARTAVAVLVAGATLAGAAQRVALGDAGPLRSARLGDLIPPLSFGGGAGAALGLALSTLATRRAKPPR
jgi:hypothetical protein